MTPRIDAGRLEEAIRSALSGKAPVLYAVINARARIRYGRSYAQLLLEDPGAAARVLEEVLPSEQSRRIIASLIARAAASQLERSPGELIGLLLQGHVVDSPGA